MSLTVALTILAVADVAIVALLAFVMTRARRLAPHAVRVAPAGAATPAAPPAAARTRRSHAPRPRGVAVEA